MFVSRGGPRYTEQEARKAIAASLSFAEALRRLGMRPAGGNHATLRRYAEVWEIPTDHFDPAGVIRAALASRASIPLAEVLVAGSSYSRGHLKRRLFREGLKQHHCELCGQGESWQGRPMSLILDHINGVADDHRLENLQVVCPNCAATLDTHCGRQNRLPPTERVCLFCGSVFWPGFGKQRYCSRSCGSRASRYGRPLPQLRKVERPPYNHLIREVRAMGYSATGRRYGVSDNAIRKWIRTYDHQADRARAEAIGDDAGGASPTPMASENPQALGPALARISMERPSSSGRPA